MSKVDITVVRVYLEEGRDHVNKILAWLETSGLNGFTVFRGVAGLGDHHHLHTASLIDLSSELPIVIEFFDTAEKVEKVCEKLGDMVNAEHIISWPAKAGI